MSNKPLVSQEALEEACAKFGDESGMILLVNEKSMPPAIYKEIMKNDMCVVDRLTAREIKQAADKAMLKLGLSVGLSLHELSELSEVAKVLTQALGDSFSMSVDMGNCLSELKRQSECHIKEDSSAQAPKLYINQNIQTIAPHKKAKRGKFKRRKG